LGADRMADYNEDTTTLVWFVEWLKRKGIDAKISKQDFKNANAGQLNNN